MHSSYCLVLDASDSCFPRHEPEEDDASYLYIQVSLPSPPDSLRGNITEPRRICHGHLWPQQGQELVIHIE